MQPRRKTYTASTPSVAYALYMREENHASKHVLQVSVRVARVRRIGKLTTRRAVLHGYVPYTRGHEAWVTDGAASTRPRTQQTPASTQASGKGTAVVFGAGLATRRYALDVGHAHWTYGDQGCLGVGTAAGRPCLHVPARRPERQQAPRRVHTDSRQQTADSRQQATGNRQQATGVSGWVRMSRACGCAGCVGAQVYDVWCVVCAQAAALTARRRRGCRLWRAAAQASTRPRPMSTAAR